MTTKGAIKLSRDIDGSFYSATNDDGRITHMKNYANGEKLQYTTR